MMAEVLRFQRALGDVIEAPAPQNPLEITNALAVIDKVEMLTVTISQLSLKPRFTRDVILGFIDEAKQQYAGLLGILAELRPLIDSILKHGIGLEKAQSVCSRVQFLVGEAQTIGDSLSSLALPQEIGLLPGIEVGEAIVEILQRSLSLIESHLSLGRGIALAQETISQEDAQRPQASAAEDNPPEEETLGGNNGSLILSQTPFTLQFKLLFFPKQVIVKTKRSRKTCTVIQKKIRRSLSPSISPKKTLIRRPALSRTPSLK